MEIISADLARQLLLKDNSPPIKIMEPNQASLYALKDGSFILYPKYHGKYSILSSDLRTIEQMVITDTYFEMAETDDIREVEQPAILEIATFSQSCKGILEEQFSVSLDYDNLTSLDELDSKIRNYGLARLTKKEVFTIITYLDEFFHRNTDTDWFIEKIYTLKTYWVNGLKSKTGKIFSHYRPLMQTFYESESETLNLRFQYLSLMAEYLDLKPLSLEHMEFFKTHMK
ncbi:MAG TPA: hypothetical protein VK183_01810 [Flavobacterium sp.]|nr:hypothetical protein [Flavobacterium sp.]